MVNPGLVLRLMTKGLWLAGGAPVLVGLTLQTFASHFAPLTIMLCLLNTTLTMIVPIGALVERRRIVMRDLGGVLLCAIGITSFVLLTRPHGGSSQINAGPALRVGLLGAVVVFTLVAPRTRGHGGPRSAPPGGASRTLGAGGEHLPGCGCARTARAPPPGCAAHS